MSWGDKTIVPIVDTQSFGQDVVNDVQKVEERFTYARINGGYYKQVLTLATTGTGKNVKLTYKTEQTADIDDEATTAAIQAALEALATPVPGDVVVSGDAFQAGRTLVTWSRALAEPYTFITLDDGSVPPTTKTFACGASIKEGRGLLHAITLNTHSGGGTIEVYDDISASDARSLIAKIVVPSGAAPATYLFDAAYSVGLVVVVPATMDVTVSYR